MNMSTYLRLSCQKDIHFRMRTTTNKDFRSIQVQILAFQDLKTVPQRLISNCLHLEVEHAPSIMVGIIVDIITVTTVTSPNLRNNMSMNPPMPHLR